MSFARPINVFGQAASSATLTKKKGTVYKVYLFIYCICILVRLAELFIYGNNH